jgi:cytochrome c-type biogenesis protein CcmF
MDIQYIGEHLFFGYAGRFALYMAFFSALFASFANYMASKENKPDIRLWRSWARKAFLFHSLMVAVASIMLLYILLNRYYEYRYVWAHVENDLGLGYLLAAFWAGQEGSLLFWILCQAVFGLILIRHARIWEAPVMTFVSISQVFMITMVLGLNIGSLSVGMSPFALLREIMYESNEAFFRDPHYLMMITDGNGLNPLLRNFWMLSHPPFTFIGYASVMVPACFALAGLWKRKYHEWIQPALPWTILGIFFLGIGILLGGVWAYESLTFGGFWAWDPIENASLVPWLVLVASLHLMLISKNKQHSYFPSFLFTFLAFIFVVYATFLTRSGVLAETSVHSFGNDGMGRQILVYIVSLLAIGITLLVINYKHLPSKDNEDPFTREFWLFVGALVLILSAFQIIFTTSIPVLNLILRTQFTPPINSVSHYNNWQLPFAIVIALLIGITHFIGWGKNNLKSFAKNMAIPLILTMVFTILIIWLYNTDILAHQLMLFASLFALFSSLDILFRFKTRLASYGTMISHLGIALFLLAVLLTFSKKTTISQNTSGYFLGQQFSDDENLLLLKGEVLPMGEYHVVYAGRTYDGTHLTYQIDFLKTNKQGDFYKVFSSFPAIQLNEKMGNVYEPYAKIYPMRDIFTYVTFADVEHDLSGQTKKLIETLTIAINDTASVHNNKVTLRNLTSSSSATGTIDPNDIEIIADIEVITHFGTSYEVRPSFLVKNGQVIHTDGAIKDIDLVFRFKDITQENFTIVVEIFEDRADFVIIKTVIFPYINLLWISMLVMLIGLWVSFRRRWRMKQLND